MQRVSCSFRFRRRYLAFCRSSVKTALVARLACDLYVCLAEIRSFPSTRLIMIHQQGVLRATTHTLHTSDEVEVACFVLEILRTPSLVKDALSSLEDPYPSTL